MVVRKSDNSASKPRFCGRLARRHRGGGVVFGQEKERQPAKHTADREYGETNNEKARRAEGRGFGFPRGFAKTAAGRVLLALLSSSFISLVLNSNFDVPGNNEHAFLSSSFILPLEAFSDEPLFPAVCIGTNERTPWLLFQSGSAAASRGSRR